MGDEPQVPGQLDVHVQMLLESHDGEAVSKGLNSGSGVERTDPVVTQYESANDNQFAGDGRASPVSVLTRSANRFDWLDLHAFSGDCRGTDFRGLRSRRHIPSVTTQPLSSPPHVYRFIARP